nr:right-handed parallel beta-helix repeat-containing protein [Paenibacillus sp. 79R4]
MYSAISIYGSNNVVANNIISGVGSFYAAIEVSAGDLIENTLIQGNSISMGDRSSIAGTTAIRLGNIRGFQLLNNNISNGERGVWTWQNADQGVIQGNSIVVRKGTGIDLTTYLSGYVQKNITCIGNNITAGKAKIVIPPRAINIVVK